MSKPETPILKYWSRSDSDKKSAGLGLAVKRLKANADAYMVEAAQETLNAEAALAAALSKSQKSPDFGTIVKASLRVKKAALTYTEATTVYTAQFGAAPTV